MRRGSEQIAKRLGASVPRQGVRGISPAGWLGGVRYRVVGALAARYNVGSWLSGGSAKRAVLTTKIWSE